MKVKTIIICVLEIGCISAQRSLTCTFGDNLVSAPLSLRSGLLLNTANRSACFGIATTWNVCYSASATDPISTTHFGVYRPSAAVSGFTLVSASNFTVPRVGNASSYSCIQLPLSKERQFLVQPGDVVAVCVRYIGKGRLGLVGTQTSNILGNEGINCLSPGLAMPPIVSQSMGAYLLNLIPHVNLDTLICLMNNGTCDPKCVNGTTQSCSFGSTQPTPQATGSQNGATSSAPNIEIIYAIVGSTCAGIFITVTSVLLLSIAYFVRRKGIRGSETISRTEADIEVPQPYLEFQVAGPKYETLTPSSGAVDDIILTRNIASCTYQEYELITAKKSEGY
eukprot:Em0008g698a